MSCELNTLQWFMGLSPAKRKEIILSIKKGQEAVTEACHKSTLQELLERLEEDHHFAKAGEAGK